jgi:hypothetical protein
VSRYLTGIRVSKNSDTEIEGRHSENKFGFPLIKTKLVRVELKSAGERGSIYTANGFKIKS